MRNILRSSVYVLIWSKRCVALYFCVCLHCCGHAVVCMCYVFVCIVAWHHLNNAFPSLKGSLWKPKGVSVNCLCGLVSCQCTKKIINEKYSVSTKYMWNTHKTLIQKYETRNSNAVSVKLVFSMHLCRCEFEPSTLQITIVHMFPPWRYLRICYQGNCHF